MTLAPLLVAPVIVQAHVAAAMLAVVFALLQLAFLWAGKPPGQMHRLIGWGFVGAMAITALGSFWITGISNGRFSWIHLLSVITLITLPIAVIARRQGNMRRHKSAMFWLLAGLMIAGAFTLMPARLMNRVVFGG